MQVGMGLDERYVVENLDRPRPVHSIRVATVQCRRCVDLDRIASAKSRNHDLKLLHNLKQLLKLFDPKREIRYPARESQICVLQ